MSRAKTRPEASCTCGLRVIVEGADFRWDLQDGMTHWRGHPCVPGGPELQKPARDSRKGKGWQG